MTSYGNRTDGEAAALCIFNQGCRRIKTHGLIIKQAHKEFGGTMHLQPATGVGNQCETDRMRFRKSVERKRRDRMQDFLNHVRRDPITRHRFPQLHTHPVHPLFRAMKTERTPQFFRFVSGKIRHDHRDFEHLFLK